MSNVCSFAFNRSMVISFETLKLICLNLAANHSKKKIEITVPKTNQQLSQFTLNCKRKANNKTYDRTLQSYVVIALHVDVWDDMWNISMEFLISELWTLIQRRANFLILLCDGSRLVLFIGIHDHLNQLNVKYFDFVGFLNLKIWTNMTFCIIHVWIYFISLMCRFFACWFRFVQSCRFYSSLNIHLYFLCMREFFSALSSVWFLNLRSLFTFFSNRCSI